jgi:hypothetical protein
VKRPRPKVVHMLPTATAPVEPPAQPAPELQGPCIDCGELKAELFVGDHCLTCDERAWQDRIRRARSRERIVDALQVLGSILVAVAFVLWAVATVLLPPSKER